MEKHVVGSKILKKEQVLISIFLIAILVLSSGSMVTFAKTNTYFVKPNGVDDTAEIQAAFNACGSRPGCTVQLVAGTYYVGQIAVFGFHGRFVGMGQGVTNIQALPNLPSPNPADNTDTTPFWAALPTPASASTPNPWPALFTFVNGAFVISGMSINEPYTATTCTSTTPCPTLGWDDAVEGGPSTDTALLSAIIITGETQSVTIDHLTVTAATTSNMATAIFDGGLLLPEGWTNLSDETPLAGTFSLTNSEFTENNPMIYNVVNAVVVVSHTTVEGSPAALFVQDVSNSKIVATENQGTDLPIAAAVFAYQSVFKPACTAAITSNCLLPSTIYVTDNNFQVNQGGSGVALIDFGTPSTLSAVVTGNKVETDTSCGCYTVQYPAILVQGLSSVLVSQNVILGGGSGVQLLGGPESVVSGNYITGTMAGVLLGCGTTLVVPGGTPCFVPTLANGVHVIGNVIKNSAQYGIAVVEGSINNKIIGNYITGTASSGYDLYWDQTGTGNVWLGNFCSDHTSSPAALC